MFLGWLGSHGILLQNLSDTPAPSLPMAILQDMNPSQSLFFSNSTTVNVYSSKSDKLDPTKPIITPIWTCLNRARPTKLVFVHVFKTAGMTMRELFLRYAVACNAGIGLVSECSGLAPSNVTISWTNGFGSKKGKPCWMKAIGRTTQDATLPNHQIETTILSELDILAGHLPLGVGSLWNPGNTTVQYVVFFRNAVDKFVSGIMYQKRDQDYSFGAIVELIQKRVKGELYQQKYREGYSAYLLTPQQKQQHYHDELHNSSIPIRTQQILQNLDQGNVLIGIVERMSESLELIQFLIDSNHEQTPLFQAFGMKPRTHDIEGSHTTPLTIKKNNPSKFSTASVVAELQKDAKFWELMVEYVKYDDIIYRHALQIHGAQHRSLIDQMPLQ